MVSTRPLISKSSTSFINPSVTVPRAPIIIGIKVTYMFHIALSVGAVEYSDWISVESQYPSNEGIRYDTK